MPVSASTIEGRQKFYRCLPQKDCPQYQSLTDRPGYRLSSMHEVGGDGRNRSNGDDQISQEECLVPSTYGSIRGYRIVLSGPRSEW